MSGASATACRSSRRRQARIPAAVVFDALQSARGTRHRRADRRHRGPPAHAVAPDGGARKIARVVKRLDAGAARGAAGARRHIGQNALRQAAQFQQALGVTGIVLTKLDGTAKGGVVSRSPALRAADPLRRRRRTGRGFRYLRRRGLRGRTAEARSGDARDPIRPRVQALSERPRALSESLRARDRRDGVPDRSFGRRQEHGAAPDRAARAADARPGHRQRPQHLQPSPRRDSGVPSPVGVVFQDHQLLDDRPVYDNVALPRVAGVPRREMDKHVRAALDQVGLLGRERSFPLELSAGEQQRVGIARAVITKPPVLIADEPTGNLDPGPGARGHEPVPALHSVGVTVIVATHDVHLLERFRVRRVHIEKGRIAGVRMSLPGRRLDPSSATRSRCSLARPAGAPAVRDLPHGGGDRHRARAAGRALSRGREHARGHRRPRRHGPAHRLPRQPTTAEQARNGRGRCEAQRRRATRCS